MGHYVWMHNVLTSHIGGRTGWTSLGLKREMRYMREGGDFTFSLQVGKSERGDQLYYYGNHFDCKCSGWMCK